MALMAMPIALVANSIISSGNWSDPAIWSGNDIGDDVSEEVIFNQNLGTITIATSETYTVSNVTMSNGNTIWINGTLNVGNTGTGFIMTAGNNTTINVVGDLIVYGDLEILNNATVNIFGKMTIKKDLIMGGGANIDIQPGSELQIDGDWQVGNNTNVNVDGTLNINGNINAGNNSEMTGSGSANAQGSCTGPESFCTNSLLPVELVFFLVETEGYHNVLIWQTATEINNDYFSVERSENGIDFSEIGIVDGYGNSSEKIKYRFVDQQIGRDVYYRLMQTDFDGTFSYSPIVYSATHQSNPGVWKVAPNPIGSSGFKLFPGNHRSGEMALYILYDLQGNILYNETTPLHEATRDMNRVMSQLAPGQYILRVSENGRWTYLPILFSPN